MGINDRVRSLIINWLKIKPSINTGVSVDETMDFYTNAFVNNIWYRGKPDELSQLYNELPVNNNSFWNAVPSAGLEIRKIHTGIPKIVVNTLSSIVVADLNKIEYGGDTDVEKMLDENKINKLIDRAIKQTLVYGDGAFKINYVPDVSNYPLLEFVPGSKIKYNYRYGRLNEIVFMSEKIENDNKYILEEIYGFGYIRYQLYNSSDKPLSIANFKSLAYLVDIEFDKSLMMAVPMMFTESSDYENRGQSIFDSKHDNFDALDEIWSQWIESTRASQTKTYIPDSLIPIDPNNGKKMKPNPFDNKFIKVDSSGKETDRDEITTVNPIVQTDSYIQAYITALDLCLQGLISPSTLGIDSKKIDNAEAQREKEKATLYTRNQIIDVLQTVIPQLVATAYKSYLAQTDKPLKEIDVTVEFGEYANPSFESQVETIAKAKVGGVMSIEASIDELYGDTKNDEWKKQEVARIKNELGIIEMPEPVAV